MPLIKPRAHRVRTLRHIARLQEPNRDVLLAYAAFIGESPDYALNQLIDSTLARDREFVTWRADREARAADSPDRALADGTPIEQTRS